MRLNMHGAVLRLSGSACKPKLARPQGCRCLHLTSRRPPSALACLQEVYSARARLHEFVYTHPVSVWHFVQCAGCCLGPGNSRRCTGKLPALWPLLLLFLPPRHLHAAAPRDCTLAPLARCSLQVAKAVEIIGRRCAAACDP